MSNPQGEANLESINLADTPAPEGVEGLLSLLLEQWDEQAISSSNEPEEQPVTAVPVPVAADAYEQEQFRCDIGQLLDPQETLPTFETATDLEEQSLGAVVASIENPQVVDQSLVALFDEIPVLEDVSAESAPFDEVISTEASFDTYQTPTESARIIPLEPSILFEEPIEYSLQDDSADDVALDNLFQSLLVSTAPVQDVISAEQDEAADPVSANTFDEAELLGSLLAGIEEKEATPEQLAEPQQPSVKEIGPLAKFVIFRLAEEVYAIPMQRVLETDRMPRVTFVPGLPASLRGITNLRGDILPIVDLRQIFGLGETELTAGHRLLVVKSNDDSQVGLIVDALGGLGTFGIELSPDERQIENEEIKQLMNGRGEHKGQTVNVLDLDKVFTVTELQELAA